MKRLIAMLSGCFLWLMVCLSAQAETDALILPDWLELSADNTVLTVRLPLENPAEEAWQFMISDESVLQLITCETLGDEEGESGEGQWVGSFMGTFEQAGPVLLQLTASEKEGGHIETRMLELLTGEDGSIQIVSAEENSWYWLDSEQCALLVSLPCNPSTGYGWTYEFSDEEILICGEEALIPSEDGLTGASGTWTATFRGTAEKAGRVTVTLRYARPWESREAAQTRTVNLFVNEARYIQLLPGE